MAQEQSEWVRSPERTEQVIEATRAVVYADDARETLIAPDSLDDALRAAGVEVGEAADGTTAYDDRGTDLSLRAAHLAVDLRRDPAEFLHPVERSPDRDAADG
jgi:hypothetical protein